MQMYVDLDLELWFLSMSVWLIEDNLILARFRGELFSCRSL